jgi:hypothetical protein
MKRKKQTKGAGQRYKNKNPPHPGPDERTKERQNKRRNERRL